MKITFILPTLHQNGGNRVIATHAANLLALGHDVRIVNQMPDGPTGLDWVRQVIRGRVRLHGNPDRSVYYSELGDRLIRIRHKGPIKAGDIPDADVVIATWWRTAFSVAALPPEKGAKVYFVQHHEVHDHLPWDLAAGSYYLPLRKITISDWLVDTMGDLYGDTDVFKVENSVDFDQFNAPPRTRNLRPRVGFMYSHIRFKGVDTILEAIEIARRRFPDLEVLAFGGRDPEPNLPMPPGSTFHRLPPQDMIPKLYASCDAWLFGSRLEGFGLPILEAMACRTPVVATRAGAAPDLITGGVNGQLADIEDSEALGARLIEVLSLSPEKWQAMSTAAHDKAHSYSWDDASRAFEAALLKIAGRS